MKAFFLLPVLLLLAGPRPAAAEDEEAESPPLQRYLVSLYLGDGLEEVQKVYPPAQEWPSYLEPRGHVNRVKVEKGAAKYMPLGIHTLWLGMKHGRLVEIQVIYDAGYTRGKSVEALAEDLSLIYGEPRRTNNKFWWTDGSTVLRAYYAEVPVLKDGRPAVELHTCLQLMEASLFHRLR